MGKRREMEKWKPCTDAARYLFHKAMNEAAAR